MPDFVDINADQRREAVNSRQRFEAWRVAAAREAETHGSMVWTLVKGREYLVRAAYDRQGRRRQSSLGPRSPETERIKAEFEVGREDAKARLAALQPVMVRQAAINRVLGLGRVPLVSARVLRLLDRSGLLGAGIRVVGTHALYAYEAACGVHFDSGLTTTEDVDLLLDSRARLSFVASEELEEASLMRLLQKADRSFRRSAQSFRAVNHDGFLVDLIKPLRNPPNWHESAPAFEAMAIDMRGGPLRMVTSDPRVFAAHKYWVSQRLDCDPLKRARDLAQARAVASLTATHLAHLSFAAEELRMLPKELIAEVSPLFVPVLDS